MHWQMGVEGTLLSPSPVTDGAEPPEVFCGLRNSVVKVTRGAGSHPLPLLSGEAGSEQSIPGGVLPPWLCISPWDPSGTGHGYRSSLQKHLLVLSTGRGELLGGFT